MTEEKLPKGPIAWMASNPVTSNILMLTFLIGGFLMSYQIKQEIFPEFELDIIRVEVPFPGATPQDVEEGLILAIEEEARSIDGVKSVKSVALEGKGTVNVELMANVDSGKLLQDIKNAIDRIQTFPEDAERPIVSLLEGRRQVISLVVYGDQSRRVLRDLAEKIRDDLMELEDITFVTLAGVPNPEIAVEIPEKNLRKYNLTLEGVAQIIRQSALDLPGGTVKTSSGEVLLRTTERRDLAREFADIPIVSNPNGSRVRLYEIADLVEGFEDTDEEAFFNGKPAVRIDVFRVGEQTPLKISRQVNDFVEKLKLTLPEGVEIATWNDAAIIFRDRIDLLLGNAFLGLILVLVLLGLFLEPRLAFWVTLGIPVSILGAMLFLPVTNVSINMISLFAFIITLGIVIDDAIVIGENIFEKREKGMSDLMAAVEGTREIYIPVVSAVLTNIAAFLPLFFVPGVIGKIFFQIPTVVVIVFLVSLVESLFVLPAHLANRRKSRFWDLLRKPSRYVETKLHYFISNVYEKVLRLGMKHYYFTVACALSLLTLTVGYILGGYLPFNFLPRVDSDVVTVQAILPFGAPIHASHEVQEKLVDGAQKIIEKHGGNISKGIYTQIGKVLEGGGPVTSARAVEEGSHLVGVQVYLIPADQREISGVEFAKEWREVVGNIVGIESLTYTAEIGAAGGAVIDIELSHQNIKILESAASELSQYVSQYAGMSDIDDGVSRGKPQLNFRIKPEARSLGIRVRDLAQQIRSAFYGAEALRQQRGRDEIKVLVRLPEKERRSLHTVEEMIIRTPTGGEIPLEEAASISLDTGYISIRRSEGKRVQSVTADVDENISNANKIISDIERNILPTLMNKYPGLSYVLQGQQKEQKESMDALSTGFIFALLLIFTMLAIPLKSYIQPLIVMSSIPFGIIGAVFGHILLGYELSIMSMFGIISLSGVVVNDSLVLTATANQFREQNGLLAFDTLVQAGTRRFRPILLTSLTTFFGLAPMIFETSMQARFLIPMAISLGFGVLFATFITLLITPALYLIVEDLRNIKKT